MFVFEDPGQKLGKRSYYLQQSQARQFITTKLHAERRAQSSSRCNDQVKRRSKHDAPRRTGSMPINLGKTVTATKRTSFISAPSGDAVTLQRFRETDHDTFPHEQYDTWAVPLNLRGTDMRECRSLQFFKEKTALEWSGWTDLNFWTSTVFQAAKDHPCITHALTALGAFHEFGEVNDTDSRRSDLQKFAKQQGCRALTSFNTLHRVMPMSALLTTYLVLSSVVYMMGATDSWKIVQLLSETVESLRAQPSQISSSEWSYITLHLAPVIDRHRYKSTQILDVIWCLRTTPAWRFYSERDIPRVETFSSIRQARDHLDLILNRASHMTKTKRPVPTKLLPESVSSLTIFLSALQKYPVDNACTERDMCQIALLQIAAKLGFMMIQNLLTDEHDQLFFDSFTPLFAEVAECFRQVLKYKASRTRINYSFGMDSGLLTLVGSSARWCRDPRIRRDIIQLLYESGAAEAIEGAIPYAQVAEQTILLEERGLSPPPQTCHDIPAPNRVKLDLAQTWLLKTQLFQFRTYPYGHGNFECVIVPHHGCCKIGNEVREICDLGAPDFVVGKGYASCPTVSPDDYCMVKDPQFFFIIPSV